MVRIANSCRRQMAFALLLMFCAVFAKAAGEETGQVVVQLEEAGTLPAKIDDSKKYTIESLKVVGNINGTDLKLIREMAGCDSNGRATSGNLYVLDLSEARIVGGGDKYYDDCSTSDDCLGESAFQKCNVLETVILPSGLKSIDTSAFSYCSSLTDVQIPDGVSTIGFAAFSHCKSMKTCVLPSGLTSLGESAFYNCSKLESVELPAGLTSIENMTFYACSRLASVDLPSGITSIGRAAFLGCTHMTSVSLPASLTSMDFKAFYGCERLESIVLPSGLTSVPEDGFYGCIGLKQVVLPAGLTMIGDEAFDGCERLESIEFPSCLTAIGDAAFYGCSSLTSLVIPSSVETIEERAFCGCTALASVYLSWQTPLAVGGSSFDKVDTANCTLYVPNGTSQAYSQASVWQSFTHIVEYEPTGIVQTPFSSGTKELSRYSLGGQLLSAPGKGVNIVKYSDGSVRKVAVQ